MPLEDGEVLYMLDTVGKVFEELIGSSLAEAIRAGGNLPPI